MGLTDGHNVTRVIFAKNKFALFVLRTKGLSNVLLMPSMRSIL